MNTAETTEPFGDRGELEEAWRIMVARLRRSEPGLLSWATAFRLEEGEPLDFALFPFQREIYEVFGGRDTPVVDVMKSAQCGISAAAVSLALYAAEAWGANVLYVLPGFDDAFDFSDTRIKTAIEASPYLAGLVASTDNKGLKRIRGANLYVRGSGSEGKSLSIPADLLILDEYDRLDQRQVPKFRKRLGAPNSLGLERRFSNPSFPESGIHDRFLASDQRSWLITCPGCGLEAPITYEPGEGHYLDEERTARSCGGCHRALGRRAVATGRWVPARPRADHPGFHVSKLIVPDQSIPSLITEHHRRAEDEIAAHYNFDLGLPYAAKGGSLTRDLVLSCRRDYDCPPDYHGGAWVTAGVDVGTVLHVRISRWDDAGRCVALYVGEVDDFTDLGQLWERYSVNFGLIDERPEERKAREFASEHGGRCMLLRWSGDDQRDNVIVDEDRRLVIARRTWACDKTVAAFADQIRLLPRHLEEAYIRQVTAPHRVTETTKAGQKVARYVSERADHYFFAETHDLLAKEARGGQAFGLWGPPAIRNRWDR